MILWDPPVGQWVSHPLLTILVKDTSSVTAVTITVQIGSHSEQRAAQDFVNLFTGTGLWPRQHPANLVVFQVKE